MDFTRVSVSERRTMPPAIAVSTVAFAIRPPADARIEDLGRADGSGSPSDLAHATPGADEQTVLWLPLVRRTREPFRGQWALPGGPTQWNETLTDTALRTVHDAARRAPGYLEQLYAFGAVERSADAQRLVTIAYWAQYGERDLAAEASLPAGDAGTSGQQSHEDSARVSAPRRWDDVDEPTTQTSAHDHQRENSDGPDSNVAWFPAHRLPALAFDHAEIVDYALTRLRNKTAYSEIAHRFLGARFTLAQLRRVHEAILGHAVDPANFRRDSLAGGSLIDTGEMLTGSAHRPARLYQFRGRRDPSTQAAPAGDSRAHARSRQ